MVPAATVTTIGVLGDIPTAPNGGVELTLAGGGGGGVAVLREADAVAGAAVTAVAELDDALAVGDVGMAAGTVAIPVGSTDADGVVTADDAGVEELSGIEVADDEVQPATQIRSVALTIAGKRVRTNVIEQIRLAGVSGVCIRLWMHHSCAAKASPIKIPERGVLAGEYL
ncbi:hypothetical protein [Nakamurella antarctica]|uniref:hypothetical protein n=1 Tax=Nakamurella antarctica TaxID=1902245 RepID=UPI001EF05EF9|nr:hypothetical protein [Nakamurella antarctica]